VMVMGFELFSAVSVAASIFVTILLIAYSIRLVER